MPNLDIKICRKNQTEPAFPEIDNKVFGGEGEFHGVAVLEAGMSSGATAVGFAVATPDGKLIMVQTSAAILRALVGAINGAEEHWKDNPL